MKWELRALIASERIIITQSELLKLYKHAYNIIKSQQSRRTQLAWPEQNDGIGLCYMSV